MSTVTTPIGSVLDNRIVKANNTIFDYLGSSDILLTQGQNNGNFIYYKDVSGEFVVSTDGRVALGDQCGRLQGDSSIAIGNQAGFTGQSDFCVAIGYECAKQNQSIDAIGIGTFAGETDQGLNSIAIGRLSGNDTQGANSIAIGNEAGQDNQGHTSIAIGKDAGKLNQHANTIIINSTGTNLNSTQTMSAFISPIAQKASGSTFNMLLYNDTTKEVVKSSAATSSFNKTFVIEHPVDRDKYLVHACLEGPEAGVYYRGKGEIVHDHTVIQLPDYLDKLATDFSVNLTPIYSNFYRECSEHRWLCCEEIKDNKLVVHGPPCKFYWSVFGKRSNIEIEVSKDDWELKGDGPYTYLDKKIIQCASKEESKEEVKQEEVKLEECKQEEVKLEEVKLEECKLEECKQEEVKQEEPKPRRIKPVRRVLVHE